MRETVAVLGASNHKERYACRAVKLLLAKGHNVLPVNPLYDTVGDLHCSKSLSDYKGAIDTITIYLNPARSDAYAEEIISVKPKRVIFNPGAENSALEHLLKESGIQVIRDCTLVMLDKERF